MTRQRSIWFGLAAVLVAAAAATQQAHAGSPSSNSPGTGLPKCLAPLKNVICVRDKRSGFLTGFGYGSPSRGYTWACSDGGLQTFGDWPPSSTVDVFNMASPNSPGFPKLPDGKPDLRYFMPSGAVVTQLIMLEAKNPFGEQWGTLAGAVFVYTINADNGTISLGFATCGNALWTGFYLDPSQDPAPPTYVKLQASFVNQESEKTGTNLTTVARTGTRFLSHVTADCSKKGGGFSGTGLGSTAYLGGDPNASQKFFITRIKSACFAPLATFVPFVVPPPRPTPPVIKYNATNGLYPRQPVCAYDKKTAGRTPSASCVAAGFVLATGKYGLIQTAPDGAGAIDWAPKQSSSSSSSSRGGSRVSTAAAAARPSAQGAGGGGLFGGRRGQAGGAAKAAAAAEEEPAGPVRLAPVAYGGAAFRGTQPGTSE